MCGVGVAETRKKIPLLEQKENSLRIYITLLPAMRLRLHAEERRKRRGRGGGGTMTSFGYTLRMSTDLHTK